MRFYSVKIILFLLFSLVSFAGYSQVKKKPAGKQTQSSKKDLFKVKAPKIQYVRPDTSILVEYEDFPEDSSDAENSVFFNPAKKLSLVNEDTTTLDMGNQEIVEMSEEVLVDTTWVKVAGYYAIWDTHNINPYRKDGRQIKDTLHVKLVEPEKDRHYKMPLDKTPVTSDFGFRG